MSTMFYLLVNFSALFNYKYSSGVRNILSSCIFMIAVIIMQKGNHSAFRLVITSVMHKNRTS